MFIGAASAVLANQLYRSLVHRYHIWQMTRELSKIT
jgi:hypothetical protein